MAFGGYDPDLEELLLMLSQGAHGGHGGGSTPQDFAAPLPPMQPGPRPLPFGPPQGRQVGPIFKASSPLESLAFGLAGMKQQGDAQMQQQAQSERRRVLIKALGGGPEIEAMLSGDPSAAAAGQFVAKSRAEQEKIAAENQMRSLKMEQEAQRQAAEQDFRRQQLAQGERRLGYEGQRLSLEGKRLTAEEQRRAAEETTKKTAAGAKAAEDLRKEFHGLGSVKSTADMADAIAKIRSVPNTGAGDLSLIYSYVKMLDPGSVVREGEIALSREPTPLLTSLIQKYKKAAEGELLHPDLRASYKQAAEKLWEAQLGRYEDIAKPYRRLAEQGGLAPDDVVLDFGLSKRAGGQSAAPGAAPDRTARIQQLKAQGMPASQILETIRAEGLAE